MFDDSLRVYSETQTYKLLGISEATFKKLKLAGDTPERVELSPHRYGYPAWAIKKWQQERIVSGPSARELLDQQTGKAA